jgi:hypothetical protein
MKSYRNKASDNINYDHIKQLPQYLLKVLKKEKTLMQTFDASELVLSINLSRCFSVKISTIFV